MDDKNIQIEPKKGFLYVLSEKYQAKAQGFAFLAPEVLKKMLKNLTKSVLCFGDKKDAERFDCIMGDKKSLQRIYEADGTYKYILNVGGWFVLLKNPEHIALADKVFRLRSLRLVELIFLKREFWNVPKELNLIQRLGYHVFNIRDQVRTLFFGIER